MNRRSFLGLFGKVVALAAVPTALLRSAPVADDMPLMMVSLFAAPGDFPLRTRLAVDVHDARGEGLLADSARV